MTIIGKLLEKWSKIEQGLEISDRRVIIENNNGNNNDEEEIKLPEQEYAVVMSTLNTWLLTSKQHGRKKYLQKGIQATDNNAYIYTFMKKGIKYTIIDKEIIQ